MDGTAALPDITDGCGKLGGGVANARIFPQGTLSPQMYAA